MLAGMLAVIAVTLAAVGLYALIGYSVAVRQREIGIRIAMGATVRGVVGLVVRHAGQLVVVGVVLGVAGAVFLSRLVEKQLFQVGRLDPLSYVVATVGLIIVGAVASARPARAAARVDPVDVLRDG